MPARKEFLVPTSWFRGIREDIKESFESFREHLAIQRAEDRIHKNRLSYFKCIAVITEIKSQFSKSCSLINSKTQDLCVWEGRVLCAVLTYEL